MSDGFERALVVGAGTMGAGIAEVLAKAGLTVRLYDVDEERAQAGLTRLEASLDKAKSRGKISDEDAAATLGRVTATTAETGAKDTDLIIEAAPENMDLKKQIFSRLSRFTRGAVLASNTSSLSVTEIAAAAEDPSRVIGLHFFNPVPIMPLLEIVRAEQTAGEVVERCRALAERIGKSPIVVMDSPGFASSRLGLVIGLEAMRMLESQVASAADIDRAMELGYRHPMGPLKLTDLVGLDVRLAIADHLAKEVGPQFAAPPILRRLVRAGKLGKKTGEGFYRWEGNDAIPKE